MNYLSCRFPVYFVCWLAICFGLAIAEEPKHPTIDGPLPPQRASESFELAAGLQVELVAGEPLIAAPVAMAFDARGRLFVVENRGYPLGPGEGKPPQGKIALLSDTNHDGQMDQRTEFADNLTFPNGLLPWRDGVIVTCAPDILFLRDTNDDGIADVREILFTGFATTGSTQLRVSHPTLSPEGWIYVANGLSGGKITSPRFPDAPPVELKRNTFRFRPDFSQGEAAGGPAQFGMSFDDFNRQFVCYNRVQVQHVVFSPQLLARHPLGFAEMLQNCPAETVGEPLQGHGAAAKLYPISQNITTADSHAGTFTAACGVTLVRGTGLPPEYLGGVLSCDPTANLLHFDQLEPNGATFAARRLNGTGEFLRSSDSWFRPVFLTFGPDGSLYVCDMYRKTIEHPDYLPVEIRKHTDFASGRDRGRIWRVSRQAAIASPQQPLRETALHEQTIPQLIHTLGHENGWQRDTAHRLLLEKPAATTQPLLVDFIATTSSPWGQVRALHLLEGRGGLSDDQLRTALQSPHAGVRENALAIAEKRLATAAGWLKDIAALHGDRDDRVLFQATLALGAASEKAKLQDEFIRALAILAHHGQSDRWFRAAVWNSLGTERGILEQVLEQGGGGNRPYRDFMVEYGRFLAAAGKHNIAFTTLLQHWKSLGLERRTELLLGIAQGMKKETNNELQIWISKAIAEATANPRETSHREGAALVELLGYATYESASDKLWKYLEGSKPELQLLAIRSLGKLRDARAINELLASARWENFSPAEREEATAAAMSMEAGILLLLAAVEHQRIRVNEIDAFRRQQLVQHKNEAIRSRAEKLFGQVTGDRAKVYNEYKSTAEEPGQAFLGRLVFNRACANCHRLNREGFAVGPDLFGIRNQPKAAILLHILVPDHEITPGFKAYQVVAKDGRTFTGLLAGETESVITLRLPQGKEETIPRHEIEELNASQLSLMPQGLEKTITRSEFADLLAYLKGEREIPLEKTP